MTENEVIGTCKDCGSEVICTNSKPPHVAFCNKNEENFDYWYYCSNTSCRHHRGFPMDDMYYNYDKIDDRWILR